MCALNSSKGLLSKVLNQNVMRTYFGSLRGSQIRLPSRHSSSFPYRRCALFASQISISAFNSTNHMDTITSKHYSDVHNGDVLSFESKDNFQEQNSIVSEGESVVNEKLPDFSIDVLVNVLRQENAEDICVIKVPEDINYTDYFVVAGGVSTRHIQAMAQYLVKVYKFMKKDRDLHIRIEGKESEDWICVDFGHTVVHFMLSETREVYELEKLWTLRAFDKQLCAIPPETIPMDYIYEAEGPK